MTTIAKTKELLMGDRITSLEVSTPTINFWDILNQAGIQHLTRMAEVLDEIAPKPGSLVYVDIHKLSCRLNGMEPLMYSAIDICTSLQISRLYLTKTIASAVDFLDFVIEKYPFRITEARTPVNPPFTNALMLQSHHRFTSSASERGILHSIVVDPHEDELTSIVSKLTFRGIFEGSADHSSEHLLMREMINFLFFHNNHRSLPTLHGKTPVQKLKTFAGYDHVHSFDPYAIEIK